MTVDYNADTTTAHKVSNHMYPHQHQNTPEPDNPDTAPPFGTVRCPRCNSIGYSNERYCACCGTSLPEHCLHCGALVEHSIAHYCAQCGTPLGPGNRDKEQRRGGLSL